LRINSWNLKNSRALVEIGVFFQVLKASVAAATAASISSAVENGTSASTSWVAGLVTSSQWEVAESINWPLISIFTFSGNSDLSVWVCFESDSAPIKIVLSDRYKK
jgi:hypothetical protein